MLKTLKEDATYRALDAERAAAAEKIGRYATPEQIGAWERANERVCNYMRQFQAARRLLLSK